MSLERDPAPRQEPVQFDDPAHEVRVRLLPERFTGLAEELIEERGHAVGQRVGVEERVVEWVPPPGPAEPDLDVVVRAPGVFEDAPHLVAEVSFDFEHQRARAAAGIVRLPGEQLAGEGVHARGRLAGADGADDEHAGVEPLLRDDEPGRLFALARHGRVVQLADHHGGRVVRRRVGPAGQPARPPEPEERLQPDPPDRDRERAREHDGDGGPGVVPDAEGGVQGRIVVGDQVERGVVADAGERRLERVGADRPDYGPDDGEGTGPHRLNPLPGGIAGWERPEGAGPGVRKRARPRTRSRPSDCRVAPSPARAVPAAPAAWDRKAQDIPAHGSLRRPAGAHVRSPGVRIGTPCRFRGRMRP